MKVPKSQEEIVFELSSNHSDGGNSTPVDVDISKASNICDEDASPENRHRRRPFSLKRLIWGEVPPIPTERSISGEYGAGWLSQLTFQWMGSIMRVGFQRPLEVSDIWLVSPDRQIDKLSARFGAAFEQRVHQGGKIPLIRALYDTIQREFWLGGICSFLASLCQVMTPFALRFLIQWVTTSYFKQGPGQENEGFAKQIGLVFGIMGMQLIQSVSTNQFIYRGFMVGAQIRGVLISAVFEKTLRISNRARAGPTVPEENSQSANEKAKPMKNPKRLADADEVGWSNGRLMNLMSTDTSRIELACGMFHLLWVSPFTIFLALALLLINMTYSALAGFALLFCGIPLLTITMKILIRRRRAINKVTDVRISMTQEIMRSIRFVKFYGWENAFLEALRLCRKHEIAMIQKLMALRNAMNAVSVALPIFASMITFVVYSVSGHELTAALVFSSLSIFNSLRMPFNLLPVVIGQVTDAWASTRRIQEYLLAEEKQQEFTLDPLAPLAIEAQMASFTWEQTAALVQGPNHKPSNKPRGKSLGQKGASEQSSIPSANAPPQDRPNIFSINDINLSIGRSELVAVIGKVGSGKSSLISALAGDMRKTAGTVTMGESIAFCPQSAWIQNATVQNNILFGKEMNREWYDQVIQACALQSDLDMLPAGDQTEIGERGITLSGGQKQRLNIARAIYFNSSIVVLDDPLSAVDTHVGRHLFENAICGLLGDKCRILATHRHDILPRCDRIIWLDEGRIKANGTYDNLISTNSQFQELVGSSTGGETDGEEAVAQLHPTEPSAEGKASDPTSLIQEEDRSVTSVEWGVYIAYIRASGSLLYGIIPFLLLCLAQSSNMLTNIWLSYWVDDEFGLSKGQYIGIYVGLGFIQAILMFLFSLSISLLTTSASRTMMEKALVRVLRAPMSFFDTTPLGRITNRFSKDVDTMDNFLSDAIRMYMLTLAMIVSVFILLIYYFHYFGVAIGPLMLLFLIAAAYYRASARDMKRHEAVLRSAVFARFSEAISGTSSIRAYGMQAHFTSVIRTAIDNMNSAYYLTFSNQRWLSARLDIVSILLVGTTGILVVTLRHVVSPSISGLVFSYTLAIVQMIQVLVKQFAELENAMNATERVHFYSTSLEQEEDENSTSYHPLAVEKSWPSKGAIVFEKVQMRYRPGLPLVLQGMNLNVTGGERIGIVGRTGAGKSSIMSALFRLTELASGSIKIDGVDISRVSCHDLRSRLSIVPQDPTLFVGTVRSNLNPFNVHTDLELWSALRQVGLVKEDNAQDSSPIHLDTPVEEEGLNFSVGQRQLMALARALIGGSQVVVFDEATSSVDLETDRRIQETIRTSFGGRTLLCIAHRLQTIIRYDRVCVMDKGTIAELDTPLSLWELKGIFRGMCDQSGIVREDFN
ncbi:ABC multidrug transporter [Penicillium paradoxum]|uniref:ABC multidrug transporter n=1 Tax=Penicillium paradoxum TaxID=176176 RepID=UPI002549A9CA|nr:ABC multidrug transporter [Penicillium paradoxum]KAJ5779811.1 ABC multidrug transporter [Penicillium paradoxum]